MYINNLDTDWTRKEIATPSTYYGYAKSGTSPSEKRWAIRKVTSSGGSQSVEWNNNISFRPNAIWDNRAAHFTALASFTASSGLTYSVDQTGNTFHDEYRLSISWTDLAGTDIYKVKITDHNGVVYNYLGGPYSNKYQLGGIATETTKTNFAFLAPANMTYSFTITAANIVSSESDVSVIAT